MKKPTKILLSACLAAAVLAAGGITYGLIQAAPSRVSMGDPVFDSILEESGITYSLPSGEQTSLSESEAIKLASDYVPDLAQKASNISARFLLYTSANEGIEGRPVWVVAMSGVAAAAHGPHGATPQLPPVLATYVILDGLTGDVISMGSVGHR